MRFVVRLAALWQVREFRDGPDRYCAVRLFSVAAIDVWVSGSHDVTAFRAGAGSEIDDIVGSPNGFFVVLDDDNGVAEIAKLLQAWPAAGQLSL